MTDNKKNNQQLFERIRFYIADDNDKVCATRGISMALNQISKSNQKFLRMLTFVNYDFFFLRREIGKAVAFKREWDRVS